MATLAETVRAALNEKHVNYQDISDGVEFVLRMDETDVRMRIHTQEELNVVAVLALWPTAVPSQYVSEALAIINEANEKMGFVKILLSTNTRKMQSRVVMCAHPDSMTVEDVQLFVMSAVHEMPSVYSKVMRLVFGEKE